MILNMPGKRPENLKELLRYINLLEEQLRFILGNIDGSDISPGTIGSDQLADGVVTATHIAAESITVEKISPGTGSALDISSNKSITLAAKKLEEAGDAIAQLVIETDKISTKVADAEGNISTLQQTAQSLESRVQDTEGNVSSLQQTAKGFELRVESTEETLEGLGTRVTEAEASLTVQAGQIAAKAEKTTVEDLTGRVTEAEADLTVQAGEIAARAKQTDLDKLSGRVTEAEASLTVQAGQISLKASKTEVKDAVDDIEIGGRNLLKNSKGDFVMPPQNDGTASDNYYSKSFKFAPAVGETYTFAADVEITDGDFDAISVYPYPGGTLVNAPIPENGRITHTFTVTVDTITQILAYAGVAGETRGNGVIFRNVKIEKGNKATDWTAAPEDLESRVLNAETAITENAEQISLRARKTEVTSAIDAIQVGGRNILTKRPTSGQPASNITITDYGFIIAPVNQDTYVDITTHEDLVEGEEYTLSMECSGFGEGEEWPFYLFGEWGKTFVLKNGKVSYTFQSPGNMGKRFTMDDQIRDKIPSGTVTVKNLKLERGNKATDWTAAPEDTEERITKAEAEIAVQAGEIQMAVTEVSNISIGGTNILPGYADERSTNRYIGIPCRDILEPHIGKEICISFECKASIARNLTLYGYQSRGVSFQGTFSFMPSTTEFARHSFVTKVHKWPDEEGYTTGAISIYDYAGEQNYTIRKVKIELGNKPTDWSPCPDDPVKTLKNTAMTLNADGIEMSTTGHFRLYANDGKNSRIKLGGDNETANFSVDESGMLGAISGDFAQGLSVGNQPVWTRGNIIISSSQPTGVHDVLWIQPMQGVQQTSHSYLNTSQDHFTGGNAMNFTLAPDSASVLSSGGSYSYSLSLRMTLGQDTTTVKDFTISAVLSTSAGSVTLTGQSVSLTGWKNVNLTLTGTSGVNLCASSGNITAAVTVSGNVGNTYMYIPRNTSLILTSKNTAASSAGAQTCTIHYIQ